VAADTRGPRLNLGCGTLVVLFLLIATAGKFLPHQGRDNPVSAKPYRSPAAKPAKRVQPSPEPSAPKPDVKPAVSARAPAIESKKPESKQPAAEPSTPVPAPAPVPKVLDKAWPDVLAGLLTELEKWVKPEAKAPSREAAKSPPAKAVSPGLEGEPPQSAKSEPGVATPKARSSPATAESTRSERSPVKSPAEPETRVWGPAGGSKPVVGKAKVINSPWDQSVEPVKLYLKRHIHDADSFEVLQWGKVKTTERGYQVRCKYRSKNVLGQYATQDRLFVLDADGVVIDVRD
jgi:hypothetical protein